MVRIIFKRFTEWVINSKSPDGLSNSIFFDMKLIFKITLLFVLISSIVFLIGATFTYSAMSREIDYEEKLFLEERLQSVVGFVKHKKPEQKMVREKMIIVPLDSITAETQPAFSDTLVTHATLLRIESHLKLDVIKRINGRAYKITLYDLIIEEDDIEDAVRESMIKTYLLLLGVSLILSLAISYYVFQPFQGTLNSIKTFSIRQTHAIHLPHSSTSEFKKLNQFIQEMTRKAQRDYQSLKEFSENASHEIQTPISIAQGKLELLMESNELTEEQMELITSAQQALHRLSKMGNSLSLLTKIENKEFSDFSEVDLSQMVNALLFDFKELMELKSIRLTADIKPDINVTGSQILLEILVTNLFNNAVRHNYPNGILKVGLDETELVVTNTGKKMEGNTEDLFLRFKKGNENPDSSGLGLSIVKKICDEHDFSVNYQAFNEQHTLTIRWNQR